MDILRTIKTPPGHSASAQQMRPDAGLVLAVVAVGIIVAVAVYVAVPL
jgi:hypothetical protein